MTGVVHCQVVCVSELDEWRHLRIGGDEVRRGLPVEEVIVVRANAVCDLADAFPVDVGRGVVVHK